MTTPKSPEEIAKQIVNEWDFDCHAVFSSLDAISKREMLQRTIADALQSQQDELAKLKRQLEVAVESLTRESQVLGGFIDKHTPESLGQPSKLMGENAILELLHCYKRSTRALAQIERIGEGNE